MYLGSALSGFADRMWEFSIPFFLLTLNRADSMLLAILYAFVAGVANVLGGPIIGYLVDKQDRLTTINRVLMVQSFYRAVADLALSRGRNPDEPPALKKVTATV